MDSLIFSFLLFNDDAVFTNKWKDLRWKEIDQENIYTYSKPQQRISRSLHGLCRRTYNFTKLILMPCREWSRKQHMTRYKKLFLNKQQEIPLPQIVRIIRRGHYFYRNDTVFFTRICEGRMRSSAKMKTNLFFW